MNKHQCFPQEKVKGLSEGVAWVDRGDCDNIETFLPYPSPHQRRSQLKGSWADMP